MFKAGRWCLSRRTRPAESLGSDLDKLHFRMGIDNREETGRFVGLAGEILGDLLEVRTRLQHWWTCGLTWEAIRLLGLEKFMLAMYGEPEGLHRLMKFLSE